MRWVTALVLVVGVCALVRSQVAPYYLSYQIHSWDDLDEWRQALHKSRGLTGDKWFKVDPHFMPPTFCVSQKQVPRNDPRGCLVLNHDTPTTQSQYNSSQDLVALLQDPSYRPFFTQQPKTYIALCFKSAPSPLCDNSSVAQSWLSLADEFIGNLNGIIRKNQLNVEIILDGDATPLLSRPCLFQRWKPLVSTWIDIPWEALFSNDPAYAYDRFEVLNLPVSPLDPGINFELLSYLGYGRFASSAYPFLCWEPSDQSIIREVFNTYLNGRIIRKQGFRYAINIDPIQFLVYSASYSGSALNYQIPQLQREGNDISSNGVSQSDTNPKVAVIPSKHDKTFYSFVFSDDLTSSRHTYGLFRHTSQFTQPTLQSSDSLPHGSILRSLTSVSNVDTQILVADDTVNFVFYNTSLTNPSPLVVTSTGDFDSFTAQDQKTTTLSAVISDLKSAPTSLILARVFTSARCAFGVQVFLVDRDDTSRIKPYSPFSSVCVAESSNVFVSASIAATDADPQAPALGCTGEVAAGMVALATADKRISYAAFCLPSSGRLEVLGPVEVDVGSSPSISLQKSGDKVYALEVHGDGYCYNSEVKNKRPYPKLCSSTPISTPQILVYNYGSLDAFFSHVRANKGAPISSCHHSIMHGVYDMGSSPSATLFTADQSLGLLEVHQGLSSPVTSECGAALAYNGLVMDSWPAFQIGI